MAGTEAPEPSSPRELLRNPEFLALTSTRFVSGMTFATIIIALALYADLFQASGVVAGLFGTAYAVVRLVLVLPTGRWIDLGNSKRYLLLGLALNAALLLGLSFVSRIEHVILLRGFQAIGAVILWLAGAAIVAEIAPTDAHGLWIGTYNQVRSLASLLGDLVGGGLLFIYGFRPTYVVLFVLTVGSALAVGRYVRPDPGTRADPEEATAAETVLRLLGRRAVLALVAFRFSFSFGKMAVVLFLPLYARLEFGMSALLIGGILAGGKLTKGVAQGYVGGWVDRVGNDQWFIVAGIAGYALGTALIPAAGIAGEWFDPITLAAAGRQVTAGPPFVALFGAYAILGFADSLRIPTSMALFVAEGEHFDAAAASLSLRSLSWQFGAALGPVVVGAMFDALSFTAGFWAASSVMVVAGALFVGLFEHESAPDSAATVGD